VYSDFAAIRKVITAAVRDHVVPQVVEGRYGNPQALLNDLFDHPTILVSIVIPYVLTMYSSIVSLPCNQWPRTGVV
jgi:hypothetical protein